jgi:NADPH:quinone reductase-like Zn-dependent oxidoreductase
MIGPLVRTITALVLSRFVSQKLVIFFLAKPSKADLNVMRGLMKYGKVTPVIDRRYSLSEVPEAIRYLEEGHARGKVVITLELTTK